MVRLGSHLLEFAQVRFSWVKIAFQILFHDDKLPKNALEFGVKNWSWRALRDVFLGVKNGQNVLFFNFYHAQILKKYILENQLTKNLISALCNG